MALMASHDDFDPQVPDPNSDDSSMFTMKQAAEVAGVSISVLQRQKSELEAAGAVITPAGWKIPHTSLVAVGLIESGTSQRNEDNDLSRPGVEEKSVDSSQEMQDPEDLRLVSKSVISRTSLRDKMEDHIYESIVDEAYNLINRRFETMQGLVDVSAVNLNPFLMLAMAPAYNIFSPFEAAEYMQNGKMPHGDSTAFGKFIEDKIFTLFGGKQPKEKKQNKERFSSIDGEITVEGVRYLTTWKSGPWTMNQSHANEMGSHFPKIHEETGCPIILGIFYGRYDQLNNKPAVVRSRTGDYFHVLVGSELWEFVTGVKNAHMHVLSAIREAQDRFAVAHGGKTFYEHMIEARLKLSESFRKTYDLKGTEEDMWEKIFRKAF